MYSSFSTHLVRPIKAENPDNQVIIRVYSYPEPVKYPGFTCPADCKDIDLKRLVWSPEADDRDRIDFILYAPFEGLSLTDVSIIGPKGDILRGKRVTEETLDPIIEPIAIWPTDHKAVLATFTLTK